MNSNHQKDIDDYHELRRLLLGPEQKQLDNVSHQIEEPEEFSKGVSNVLPQAVTRSIDNDDKLVEALAPSIERVFGFAIKRDINQFADALFPVIGPAIRKSIAETFKQMIQSLNKTVEQSFSRQGLLWRIESWRTGVPIAQIALLHGLIYRTEQIFLIHRSSGLLIQHVTQDDIVNQNADVVSSMLSAITDFVGDSFEQDKSDTLNSIDVGGMSIWIEQGPEALIAVAIRGEAPVQYRDLMRQTLESIHQHYADRLVQFDGDVDQFEDSRVLLAECMQHQYKQEQKKTSIVVYIAWLLIIGLLIWWVFASIQRSQLQSSLVEALKSEPGYVVTDIADENGFTVRGLRDTLSKSPDMFLQDSTIKLENVDLQFDLFYSLDSEFVLQRATKIIAPPPNVVLNIDNNQLIAEGYADQKWIDSFQSIGRLIPGVDSVTSNLSPQIDLSSLDIPSSVNSEIDINNGSLIVGGYAPERWIDQARETVLSVPGIKKYDDSAVKPGLDLNDFNASDSVWLELSGNVLVVKGDADQNWIEKLFDLAIGQVQIDRIDIAQLRNTTLERFKTWQIKLIKKVFFLIRPAHLILMNKLKWTKFLMQLRS